MKKILLACTLLIALIAPASAAYADIIYNWDYATDTIFTNMKWTNESNKRHGIAGGYGDNKTIDFNGQNVTDKFQYRWGDSYSNYSAVDVSGASGTVTANGDSVKALEVNHKNSAIYTHSLSSGTILASIKLTGDNGKANFTLSSALDFHFIETPNTGKYQNDIFFMTEEQLMDSVSQFIYEGITYEVTLHSNLKALEGEYLKMAQEAIGADASTILYGWTTLEGKNHTNYYELSLGINAVPVPAAVWLMGTGLAGLVAVKRRQKK